MKMDISTQIFHVVYNKLGQCRTVVRRPDKVSEEPGSNHGITLPRWSISFVKKLFIVCLIEHHSLNLMRTNNENGYEYTKFQRYIQHRGHCRVVVKRPHRMLEEPGSNHVSLIEGCTYFVKKWFIVCLIEHRSSNFMRTNNEKGYKYTNFP